MSSKNSDYGDIHRYEPARESTAAAVAIVLLTLVEIVFVGLFTYGLVDGWGLTPLGNMYLGGILAVIFVILKLGLSLVRDGDDDDIDI
jgi:hypothetical protein